MWKIITLSLFIATQAFEIEDVYGIWSQVAFYPLTGYVPACIEFVFEKDPSNVECSCVDGKIAKLTHISLLLKEGTDSAKVAVEAYPVLSVKRPEDVTLDVACTCGEKDYKTRTIIRSLSQNYFVMYEKNKNKNYTVTEPNDAYVFAKKVPKNEDLIATLQSIEELKDRRGAVMCASDVNLESTK